MKIDDMPVMKGPSTTPPPLPEPPRVSPSSIRRTPPPHPESSSSSKPKKPIIFPRVLVRILGVVLIILVLGHFAPKMLHKPVPPSTVKERTNYGDRCGLHGKIVKAVLIDKAGPYPLYQITCTDGTTLMTAQ